jgi:hypothetical protein
MKNCTLNMKQNVICILCCISVILIVVASGCITPPKENATILKKGTTADGKVIPGATATPKNFVTEVTPFVTVTPTGETHTIPVSTMSPGDLYCRIYTTKTNKNDFYNKSAIAFNLQNPPMFINYTVKPSNITYTDYIDYQITNQKEKQVKVDTYSPISWYVVKVMDKETGEIYLEDGFGKEKYSLYLNNTLKISNQKNLQIEFTGNNITATAMVWVQPEGNFNDTTQFNRTTDCAYFPPNPRSIVSFATTKTTATPTYRATLR